MFLEGRGIEDVKGGAGGGLVSALLSKKKGPAGGG